MIKDKLAEFLDLLQGFRKTIVMVVLIVIATVFRIENLIASADFASLLQGTVIAFFSANSIEHIGSVVLEHLKSQKDDSQS